MQDELTFDIEPFGGYTIFDETEEETSGDTCALKTGPAWQSAWRFATAIKAAGFLPTQHFIQRICKRVIGERLGLNPKTFRSDFFSARHFRQTRIGKSGVSIAVVRGIPIFYRVGGWQGNRIVLITAYEPDYPLPSVTPIAAPQMREAETEAEWAGSDRLTELYESSELMNEGLLSFEYPLLHATDEELDQFLGKIARKVGRTASSAAKTAGRVAKTAGRALNTVTKVVPTSVLTSALARTPMGMAVRAGMGAISAAASGKNVFQGAIRSLAADPAMRFAIDTAGGVARGQNIFKAAQQAAQAGIGDARESLRFAAMVAPFVPGVGTGVAAALGAANALAAGQRITDALIAGARNALPGGAMAQTAFDMATNLAKGKSLAQAALSAARSRLPGGPAAQAAFDTGLALARGKSLQQAMLTGAGKLLPKSPYSADVMSFVRKAASGQNIGRAALSTAGNVVLRRIEAKTGPVISSAAKRLPVRQLPLRREVGEAATWIPERTGTWFRQGGQLIVAGA
jgi:hypothetical protein